MRDERATSRPTRDDRAGPGGAAGRPGRAVRRAACDGRHPAAVFFAAAARGLRACSAARRDPARAARHRRARPHRRPRRATDESAVESIVARAHAVPHRRLVRSARRSAARRCCRSWSASIAIVCAIMRKWRIAAFAVFVLVVESATYRVDVARRAARAARTSRGSRTCRPTRATRPATPPRRSPSTPASCCCSRRAFPSGGWRVARLGRSRSCSRSFVALLAHVPRHAPPARRRPAGALIGIGAVIVLLFACRAAGVAARAHAPAGPAPGPPRAERSRVMKVAVVAHAAKTLGDGLARAATRARRRRASRTRSGTRCPKAKKAPEQVERALDEGAELVFAWGGDGTVRRCVGVLAGTRRRARRAPGRDGEPVRHQPRHPVRHRARGRRSGCTGDAARLDVGRFAQRALRRHGRRRLRRRDDPRRRRPQGARRPRRLPLERRAPPARGRLRRARSRSTAPTGTRAARPASCSATSATSSAASRCSPTRGPTTACSSSASCTAEGLAQWTRTLARTAVGDPSRSPFVRVTKARKVKVELDRKVRYELDGGDRSKVQVVQGRRSSRARCASASRDETRRR